MPYYPPTSSGSGAPTDATYITQTANGTLSAEQAMGALATGLVKNTTTTGVQSIATEGTDYYKPGGTDVAITDGGTGASTLPTGLLIGAGTGAITAVTAPAGTVVGTTDTQTLTNKTLSDVFMGSTFQSLSATPRSIVLLASTKFEIDKVLEIGSSFSLEIPATSSLEITAYDVITTTKLSLTKYVDSNSWTIYDFKGWKEYRKRFNFTSVTVATTATALIASSSLPVGLADLSAAFMSYIVTATANAGTLVATFEGSASSTTLAFTGSSTDTSRVYTGFIDVTIVTN